MYRLTVMIPEELMKMAEELKQHPPLSVRKAGTVNTSAIIRLALQRGLDQLVEEQKEESLAANLPEKTP